MPNRNTVELNEQEIRCTSCNKLLGKGRALVMTIKCTRCKAINTITGSTPASR